MEVSNWTDNEYKQHAQSYCRSVVWLWLIGGGVYTACTGRTIELPMLLLFVPGIFVACVVGWIGFNISTNMLPIIRRVIDALDRKGQLNRSPGQAMIVAAMGAGLMRWAVPVYTAVLYVRLARAIVASL